MNRKYISFNTLKKKKKEAFFKTSCLKKLKSYI